MATTPVFACRRCGKPVVFGDVVARSLDELKAIMAHLNEIALCDYCTHVKLWLQSQGRQDEFLVNPQGIIYNVIDESGLDYYGKKMK